MKSLRRLACPSRFVIGEHIINSGPKRAPAIAKMASTVAALLALTFSQPAAAAPGDPDLTFHGQGWTTVPVDISSGFRFAIQDDGRMVAVGSGGPSRGDRLALTRVLPDGTPDLTYFPVSSSEPGRFIQGAPAIGLQPDGKLLVAGLASVPPTFGFQTVLLRYLTDGALDPEFGGGSGFVTVPINVGIAPKCVAVQSSGRILLSSSINLMRFEPSGERDTTFVEPDSGGVVKVLKDDKIIRCRNDDNTLLVQRLLPGGNPDNTFGESGTAIIPVPAALAPAPPGLIEEDMQVEVLPDGRIWIGGELRRGTSPSQPPIIEDLLVMRLLPDGKADTGFNGSGVAVFNNVISSRFAGIIPQPLGALILAGYTDKQLILTYLRQDGTLDPRFGAGGRVVRNFGESNEDYFGAVIAPGPERRILLAGIRFSPAASSLVLRRYENLLETAAAVEYPPGTVLKNSPAQPMDFGTVTTGARIREFTLRNAGSRTLSGLTVSLADESHAGEFVVRQLGATSLMPEQQTTFLVVFTPLQSAVPRTATLRISGRDADATEDILLFSSGLTGRLATALEAWRDTWFGATENMGFAADLADFDGDGMVNLLEYALGANPLKSAPSSARAVVNGTVLEYSYTRPAAALTEVDYLPEAAANPAGPWSSAGLTSTLLGEADGVQTVRVTAPVPENAPAQFVRLRVSRR